MSIFNSELCNALVDIPKRGFHNFFERLKGNQTIDFEIDGYLIFSVIFSAIFSLLLVAAKEISLIISFVLLIVLIIFVFVVFALCSLQAFVHIKTKKKFVLAISLAFAYLLIFLLIVTNFFTLLT